MSEQREGRFLGGLLLGGVAGAIAGLMLAPEKGRDLRRRLRDSLEEWPQWRDEALDTLGELSDDLRRELREGELAPLPRLKEALRSGLEAGRREWEAAGQRLNETTDPEPTPEATDDDGETA
jgi:gas vesicle protein